MPDNIPARVRRGANKLDEFYPNWWNNVDLDRLNMISTNDCVLAQQPKRHEDDDFVSKLRMMGISGTESSEHGFSKNVDSDYETYGHGPQFWKLLNEEWARVIMQRRDAELDETEWVQLPTTVDSLVKKHADALQKTYDNRTAGDYTFVGALTVFLMELKADGLSL